MRGMKKISFGSELKDPISFPKYDEKRAKEEKKSGLNEAVSIVKGAIEGNPALVAVLELQYMMGSLGTYMGEELTKMFEYAISNGLQLSYFQLREELECRREFFSLMQMAKTSAAIGKFQDAGLLYISVLTNPTTGGVSASFASLGDIIIAEPNALIGFAGPRVIEQTIKKKLPKGFQRAEKLEECGFVDIICERESQRRLIAKLLKHHVKIGAKYE